VKLTRTLWLTPFAILAPVGSAAAAVATPATTPAPPAAGAFTVVDVGAAAPTPEMTASYGVPELLDAEASMTAWGFGVHPGFPLVGNSLLYHLRNTYTSGQVELANGESSLEARFVVAGAATDLQRIIDAVEASLPLADPSVMERDVSSGNDDGVEYLTVDLRSPYDSAEPNWDLQVSNDTEDSPDAVSIIISRDDYRLESSLPLAPQIQADYGDEMAAASAAGLGEPIGASASLGASFGFVTSNVRIDYLYNGAAEAAGNAACGAFQLTAAPSEYSEGAFVCEREEGSTRFEIQARPNYSDEAFTDIELRFSE